MRNSQRWLVTTALAIPLVLVAGCASGAPTDAGGETESSAPVAEGPYGGVVGTPEVEIALEALYQEALDAGEDQVVVYGPPPPQDYLDAFMDRFPGIEIIYEQLQSQDRITRLEAEKASGNYAGDVAQDGRTPVVNMGLGGWCEAVDPIVDVPSDLIGIDGTVFYPQATVFGVLINTDLLDPADAPRTWEDLIDPKWKGKEVMVSPAAGGAGAFASAMLLTPEANAEQWGMKIVEGLKANVDTVAKDAQTVSSVVEGTYPIGVLAYYPYYFQTIKDVPNAPVEFILLDEGNTWSKGAQCKIVNAPHPHAAELWLNWVFSDEGQNMLAETGAYPVMPGIGGPTGLPSADQAGLITLLSDEDAITGYADYVKQVQALYGG